MGKAIYFINAIAGLIAGIIIVIVGILSIITKEFSINSVSWIIIGILSILFAIYEWKKYRSAKKK
ncbi:hypothetical protein GOV14_05750 [Candidatus Pacearchaeota archaeon]|nr:hypothetical protein [Candidatus Pacearchaeota archaeon]